MLVLISCAKTMASRCSVVVPEVTVPKFEAEAVRNALEMSQYPVSELERLLRVNTKIATENCLRFHDFCSEENHPMPAICAAQSPTLIHSRKSNAAKFRFTFIIDILCLFMVSCFSSVAKIRPYAIPDYLFCFKAYYKCYIQSKKSRQGRPACPFRSQRKRQFHNHHCWQIILANRETQKSEDDKAPCINCLNSFVHRQTMFLPIKAHPI